MLNGADILWGEKQMRNKQYSRDKSEEWWWSHFRGKTCLRRCRANVWGENLPHQRTNSMSAKDHWWTRNSKGVGVGVLMRTASPLWVSLKMHLLSAQLHDSFSEAREPVPLAQNHCYRIRASQSWKSFRELKVKSAYYRNFCHHRIFPKCIHSNSTYMTFLKFILK